MHDTLTIHHATLTPAERGRLGELNERLGRYFRKLTDRKLGDRQGIG